MEKTYRVYITNRKIVIVKADAWTLRADGTIIFENKRNGRNVAVFNIHEIVGFKEAYSIGTIR